MSGYTRQEAIDLAVNKALSGHGMSVKEAARMVLDNLPRLADVLCTNVRSEFRKIVS